MASDEKKLDGKRRKEKNAENERADGRVSNDWLFATCQHRMQQNWMENKTGGNKEKRRRKRRTKKDVVL